MPQELVFSAHILSADFEPLLRRRKKKSVKNTDGRTTASKTASSSAVRVGKYGTSISGPIHSMSSFIRSALAESNTTPNSSSTEIAKGRTFVKNASSVGGLSGKKRGYQQKSGERGTHTRKKVKLGECVYMIV